MPTPVSQNRLDTVSSPEVAWLLMQGTEVPEQITAPRNAASFLDMCCPSRCNHLRCQRSHSCWCAFNHDTASEHCRDASMAAFVGLLSGRTAVGNCNKTPWREDSLVHVVLCPSRGLPNTAAHPAAHPQLHCTCSSFLTNAPALSTSASARASEFFSHCHCS